MFSAFQSNAFQSTAFQIARRHLAQQRKVGGGPRSAERIFHEDRADAQLDAERRQAVIEAIASRHKVRREEPAQAAPAVLDSAPLGDIFVTATQPLRIKAAKRAAPRKKAAPVVAPAAVTEVVQVRDDEEAILLILSGL